MICVVSRVDDDLRTIANWADLVEFEVVPVMASAEALAQIGPRL